MSYHANLLTDWQPDPMNQYDAPAVAREPIADFTPKAATVAMECDYCPHIIMPGAFYWQDDTAYWYCSPSCGRMHVRAGRE